MHCFDLIFLTFVDYDFKNDKRTEAHRMEHLQQKSLGIAGNESFYRDDERIYAGVIPEKRVERE